MLHVDWRNSLVGNKTFKCFVYFNSFEFFEIVASTETANEPKNYHNFRPNRCNYSHLPG